MKLSRLISGCLCCAPCVFASCVAAGNFQSFFAAHAQRPNSTVRVTIQVTGGDNAAPIENASVYLKYVEEHKIVKDKKYELNVKTNREGIAHVPDAAVGRVLIQIVAEGWKTFGRWYDITDAKQPIKIRLERPPKWY